MKSVKNNPTFKFELKPNEKMLIEYRNKNFSLQAKQDEIYIEGVELRKIFDYIIQFYSFPDDLSQKKKRDELVERYFQMYS